MRLLQNSPGSCADGLSSPSGLPRGQWAC